MAAIDLLLVLAAYLVGSLPVGLVVGRLRGVDLREHGSRNIGATNAGRVLGRPWFHVVFVLDFAKGFVPALLVSRYWSGDGLAAPRLALATGIAAVVGHVFSLFLRFRGGKGVATGAGLFAALAPLPTVLAFAAWLVVARASGFVSLASVVAAVALPLLCWLLPRWKWCTVDAGVQWASLLVGALIVVRHRANLRRLLQGEEPRSRPQAS